MAKTNGFREEEFVVLSHYDKQLGQRVETVYPKVGGRLRLAHEDNDQISINTELIRFEEGVAVVKAVVETRKGSFSGLGMASLERDQRIAPAILELAETRAIARALRFAGYGVEYCGAEEISHLPSGNDESKESESAPQARTSEGNGRKPGNGNGNGHGNGNGNGSGNGRITNKQLNYIVNLGKELGLNSKGLDQEALSAFGIRLAHLSIKEASDFIDSLHGQRNVG